MRPPSYSQIAAILVVLAIAGLALANTRAISFIIAKSIIALSYASSAVPRISSGLRDTELEPCSNRSAIERVSFSNNPSHALDYESDYQKDACAVYFNGSVLPDADPNTFRAYVFASEGGDDEYAVDRSHVWFFDSIMRNADPLSFVVATSVQPCPNRVQTCTFSARDAYNLFLQDQTVR